LKQVSASAVRSLERIGAAQKVGELIAWRTQETMDFTGLPMRFPEIVSGLFMVSSLKSLLSYIFCLPGHWTVLFFFVIQQLMLADACTSGKAEEMARTT